MSSVCEVKLKHNWLLLQYNDPKHKSKLPYESLKSKNKYIESFEVTYSKSRLEAITKLRGWITFSHWRFRFWINIIFFLLFKMKGNQKRQHFYRFVTGLDFYAIRYFSQQYWCYILLHIIQNVMEKFLPSQKFPDLTVPP